MRKKIVAGNWKMNLTREAGTMLISEVVNMVRDEVNSQVQVVLCMPYPYLGFAKRMFRSQANIALGAQNCHEKPAGAYTGEVSASILRSFEVDYVIVGHSERREYFKESDELLAEKVRQVLANQMTPIFCCGESLALRQNGDYVGFVKQQLTTGLFHLPAQDFIRVVIAYEPIWAIGTGLTASPEQAQEMHAALRQHIANHYGETVAAHTTLLYGGSCNAQNAPSLFACPDVDGGLIGGASLKSREFVNICKSLPA
ncbi:MAG: triose-phosphate isomerase [Cytophagales bacterium]|nr:triose-phosphate isomerase [Bernardetiaceae bacterium]MDW8203426.1 triose-phosphate isomerase [Cytophagales bacterium]